MMSTWKVMAQSPVKNDLSAQQLHRVKEQCLGRAMELFTFPRCLVICCRLIIYIYIYTLQYIYIYLYIYTFHIYEKNILVYIYIYQTYIYIYIYPTHLHIYIYRHYRDYIYIDIIETIYIDAVYTHIHLSISLLIVFLGCSPELWPVAILQKSWSLSCHQGGGPRHWGFP